jgi:predicted AAA+ superfamily ATPase
MIERDISRTLTQALDETPAVCLLGPRQTGKTTLALAIQELRHAIYLDLESERDRSKLAEAELYLTGHLDRLVILDEVHRAPGLFPVLRGLIDHARRTGPANGRYLLLGSASPDLLRQSGESLAGRIRYLELHPFSILEASTIPMETVWLRGGFSTYWRIFSWCAACRPGMPMWANGW